MYDYPIPCGWEIKPDGSMLRGQDVPADLPAIVDSECDTEIEFQDRIWRVRTWCRGALRGGIALPV